MQESFEQLSDEEILETIIPRKPEVVVGSKARNERQYWTEKVALMIQKPYVRAATLFAGLPTQWIMDTYLYVNRPEVKSPPALFWYMVKRAKDIHS